MILRIRVLIGGFKRYPTKFNVEHMETVKNKKKVIKFLFRYWYECYELDEFWMAPNIF